MSLKVTAAAVAEGALVVGQGVGELNVRAFCRSQGVAPKTFYKWVKRYRDHGSDGLVELSRRPRSSPNVTPIGVEEQIVRLRKELEDAGLDHGPTTIVWHLGQQHQRGEIGIERVPSNATVWRILVRRGLITPAPRKRPNSAIRRFEAPAPNEWWQIDAMDLTIATGVVKAFNLLDDHSRVLTGSTAFDAATGENAWNAFCHAAAIWGLPAGMLSDNGLCFSGKLRGFEVLFEARLRNAGIRPFTGRPYHPQTTGKVERVQQTIRKWLRKQPIAGNLTQLQAQLDAFALVYNFERPHQGINREIPAERWNASPTSGPASEPLAHPTFPHKTFTATVCNGGCGNDQYVIGVGAEYNGLEATITIDTNRANVFINNQLIRHLELNPNRRYQPTGRPRGGPKRPRLNS